MIDLDFLTGKKKDDLILFLDSKHYVHYKAEKPLALLFEAAKKDGLDLALASGFRSYQAQEKIWNDKCLGLRPILDDFSKPIDISLKSKEEILFHILRWSSLPGASRHHWGTDFDIYDKKSIAADYKIQLIPEEYQEGGPFFQLSQWLEKFMDQFHFLRPYQKEGKGVGFEPWHLSYYPLSDLFLADYSYLKFKSHLDQSEFLLVEEARNNSFEIYHRYIQSLNN